MKPERATERRTTMVRRIDIVWFLSFVFLSFVMLMATGVVAGELDAHIVPATGVQGGLVVHLGCGDGTRTAALRVDDRYVVQGLDTDAKNVQAARRHIQALGLYGKISIEQWVGAQLPYIDNLVNLVVAENLGETAMPEVMRVLAPGGVAYIRTNGIWTKTVKPWPAQLDQWTHYMHDPQGTMVSRDEVVGPPRRMQWVGDPKWLRNHDFMASFSGMVSAGGRIFYIIDEGLRQHIYLPGRWALVARDGFNGTVLWKRPIDDWFPHTWPFKSGPADLPRRLVAVGDRVYVTLGIRAPLTVLDASTGQTIRTYDGTQATEEIVAADGVLYLLVDPDKKAFVYKHVHPTRDAETSRVNRDFGWSSSSPPRLVMAVAAESGQVLWQHRSNIAPLTLALDAQNAYFFDGEHVVALDRTGGQQRWISEPAGKVPRPSTGYAPRLIVGPGVVALSTPRGALEAEAERLVGISTETGKVLWRSPQVESGHHSPEDLYLVNGVLWTVFTGDAKRDFVKAGTQFQGVDLHTGVTSVDFVAEHLPAFFMHQRCYPGRATGRYIMTCATGTEFLDLATHQYELHHWLRGVCIYGLMPSNGLLYRPPETCACYYQSRVTHFCALAPEASGSPGRLGADRPRLEKGAALAETHRQSATVNSASSAAHSSDWPTYRHDVQRSGATADAVSAQVTKRWTAHLGGRLSPLTAADGKLFLSAIDQHMVYALQADSGRTAWSFTAGGRVDSPPTIHQGRVLFGCADGWVYCLRSADGELLWRYRVAPGDDKLVCYDQVESVWPLHGSLLVQDGVVYGLAGRNMFLDAGMRLVRLQVVTGQPLSETVLDDKDPHSGQNLQTLMAKKSLPVANPDVLSYDGAYVYMAGQRFNLAGQRVALAPAAQKETDQAGEGRHLFCPTGFLDDSWYHRSYWIYGKNAGEGHSEYPLPRAHTPTGRIMVFDPSRVYASFALNVGNNLHPATAYVLYAAGKDSTVPAAKSDQPNRAQRGAAAPADEAAELRPIAPQWISPQSQLLVNSMVLAGGNLFVAGPPHVADERKTDEYVFGADTEIARQLQRQEEAWQGKEGGVLCVVSAENGKPLAQYKLDAIPVWDGLIAAAGRLYLSTIDGSVVCLGHEP
jgi:outer membrane protein assembly factor BamB